MMKAQDDNTSEEKKKLFLTTSDIMNTINKSIASLDSADDALSPRVELQRRMPDGSTRRADDKDLEAADMESKLRQAGEQVADLNPQQKIEWAERQRQEGNKLYNEGDYREALDIYLTCLVAKTDDEDDFVTLVFLPVMNNLAQCALQLKMYRKAQQFCTLTLNEIGNEQPSLPSQQQLVAKLHFRRARARRLSADYQGAKSDIEAAMNILDEDTTEYRSVQREMQLIQQAELEERRNMKRQERAMQSLLGSNINDSTTENSKGGLCENEKTKSAIREASSGLYPEDGVGKKRTYSALTSIRRTNNEAVADELEPKQGYWRWYISMVGRGAEKLLVLLGNEEYIGRLDPNLARRRKDD